MKGKRMSDEQIEQVIAEVIAANPGIGAPRIVCHNSLVSERDATERFASDDDYEAYLVAEAVWGDLYPTNPGPMCPFCNSDMVYERWPDEPGAPLIEVCPRCGNEDEVF